MSIDAILIANHVAAHAKIFRKPLPLNDQEIANTVVDPGQSIQMVSKLIEEKLRHLNDLHYSWGQRASEALGAANTSPVDFAPRYFTMASKDLHGCGMARVLKKEQFVSAVLVR